MTDSAVALGPLADELLAQSAAASSGRATRALHAAPGGVLTQVVLALMSGRELSEHENPGEAFLQILRGRARLTAGDEQWDLGAGDLVAIPQRRHALLALEDAVVVLTMARVTSL
ncbi:LuxR family transcriptional regulator [Flexivirga endophytica]|uniref:LuxR family transcriptional regulator n=1 Tax=Flexivirga endophytica TaxID=1849103 RepID=A0A916SRR1_9MICO|nr:cupin domain-containing protein [Flexivirga endophytica]GGB14446.1 LuxR family transcriptional regulator [Flexivirga endophytica]GHB65839.1 LuxR family transcriptional regulator [Flexivirga endophytica]